MQILKQKDKLSEMIFKYINYYSSTIIYISHRIYLRGNKMGAEVAKTHRHLQTLLAINYHRAFYITHWADTTQTCAIRKYLQGKSMSNKRHDQSLPCHSESIYCIIQKICNIHPHIVNKYFFYLSMLTRRKHNKPRNTP